MIKSLWDYVLEADKKPDDNVNVSDYTEVEEPEETEEPTENNEGEDAEQSDETDSETPVEDNTEDEKSEDYTEVEEPEESGDSADTSSTEDEESEEPNEGEDNEMRKKNVLLNDFIRLFQITKNTHDKLVTLNLNSVESNKLIIQLSRQMVNLKDEIFTYITKTFKEEKYLMNLYKYNQSFQALNLIISNIKQSKDMDFFKKPNKK